VAVALDVAALAADDEDDRVLVERVRQLPRGRRLAVEEAAFAELSRLTVDVDDNLAAVDEVQLVLCVVVVQEAVEAGLVACAFARPSRQRGAHLTEVWRRRARWGRNRAHAEQAARSRRAGAGRAARRVPALYREILAEQPSMLADASQAYSGFAILPLEPRWTRAPGAPFLDPARRSGQEARDPGAVGARSGGNRPAAGLLGA
jgi:hypothetical protein